MFNNLIESNLHTRDLKRRGSFVLFTAAVYAVLFVTAGVASIYAYDAHLNNDNNAELALLTFVPFEPQPAVAAEHHRTASAGSPRNSATVTHAVDPKNVVDTINPNNVPTTTGKPPSALPQGRPGVPRGNTEFGSDESSPGSGNSSGLPNGTGTLIVPDIGPAPPQPTPRPVPRTISKPVLNGFAIELPKPPYSEMAKRAGAHGVVEVQVLIDESGRVVSAHAVSGHPLLVGDAVRAAYRARFSPTRIGEEPVKVSGVINYNFMLQ